VVEKLNPAAVQKLGSKKVRTSLDPGAERILELADGRKLCFAEFGASDGFPVIALHGTPGSRLMHAPAHDAAARLGLRIISPDRWGYGGSDVHPRPSLSAYADDVEALSNRLDINEFAVVGTSGGAPFALAVAAAMKKRVARLALVSPMGPTTPAGEMHISHHLCFRFLPRIPGAPTALCGLYRLILFTNPKVALAIGSVATVRVDQELIRTPVYRDHLKETFRTGLADGPAGPATDLKLFSRPWDIDLNGINAPTRVWLGTEDRIVPQAAARRIATEIPFAQLTLLDRQGHFWISRGYTEVLAWLARR
jgi:pimeloyl-ACP methyl ester carboxylesterase